jgi:fumarate reductase subunit C
MSQTEKPTYTEFHPRWYRPRMSTYWWLKHPSYLAFILREVSSVFVAWFVIYLLLLVGAVSRGEDAYARFLDWSGAPGIVVLNVVSLFFLVFHAVTWFNLAPQAMVLRYKGKRVPEAWIAYANYGAWAFVSLIVALIVLLG